MLANICYQKRSGWLRRGISRLWTNLGLPEVDFEGGIYGMSPPSFPPPGRRVSCFQAHFKFRGSFGFSCSFRCAGAEEGEEESEGCGRAQGRKTRRVGCVWFREGRLAGLGVCACVLGIPCAGWKQRPLSRKNLFWERLPLLSTLQGTCWEPF